jgi:predicted RNA-binding protein (virulence factor B family)
MTPPRTTSPTLSTVAELAVIRRVRTGLLLDGGRLGELLLPARELEGDATPERVRVFIYPGHEGEPRVTTTLPRVLPGEVGRLRVVSVGHAGAFLDWGLPKDLLLPFAEQTNTPEPGRWQTIIVLRDADNRPYASTRLERHLQDTCTAYRQGEAVPLLLVQRTDLGYKVAVGNRYWGLLASEGREDLRMGQRHTGYVQRLRDDQRLSLSLNPPGAAKSQGLAEQILARLAQHHGYLPLCDKSDPADIRAAFQCSKSAFKQAIGQLYKAHKLVIETDGIRLP